MKRNIVIAVVTAAALVGGGTATALAVAGDDDSTSVTRTDDDRDDRNDRNDRDDRDDRSGEDDDAGRAAAPGDVTAAEAVAAALKHTPGTAVSAELDDGSWEIDVLAEGDTWHSVRIAPDSGKVLGAQRDDEDDAAEVRAALKNASVTAEQAAKAAESKGTVVSVDLDDDGDDRGWDTETRASGGDEREWKVDLRSGAVTTDRDDD
ncbi:PepSY domain-containing protein [Streptomyces sp. Vc74B-19]|uniref:PepSY domain-containing protein n=1 Tax=Streptomyces sp. Vc74B-19 TaxID=2741324 RepID=UPI001BFCC6E6|nr:PepSY domain-containing protein [Streptomyces sp. Vc74B-19]MBT3163608.1 PepSY domain-containing protein [Streptomyces sp. Vc74B-19]